MGTSRVKINEKNTILTPFTIIDRLTSPYSFSRTNRESLNDKMELYFHDFSFVPLFMQVSLLSGLFSKTVMVKADPATRSTTSRRTWLGHKARLVQ